ncbi:MAG: hypothetical protein RLZZ546_1548 [Bacteroidota bacterium]|jgi:hypothetical protein
MQYEKLIEKLIEYGFVFKPLPNGGWGYSEYVSENYNMSFVYGSSNGDSYYILRKNEEVILHEDASIFSSTFKKDSEKICRKVYKKIQKIVRKERIDILLNGENTKVN